MITRKQSEMKCNPSICKAECCGPIPFDRWIYKNRKRKLSPGIKPKRFGNNYILVTENQVCGFLDKNFSCRIYDVRPEICRNFGESDLSLMKCKHLGQVDEKVRQEQISAMERNFGRKNVSHL